MGMRSLTSGGGMAITKIVAGGLLLLAVAGLVFTDVGSVFGGGGGRGLSTEVARVGGEPITVQELSRALEPAFRDGRLTPQLAWQMGVVHAELDRLINARIAVLAARDLGIDPSDAAVAAALLEEVARAAPDQDARALLAAEFAANPGKEEAVAAEIRQAIAAQILGQALTAPGVNTVPESVVRAAYIHENEARDMELVLFRPSAAPEPGAAPEDALTALYAGRRDIDFAIAERRALVVAEVKGADADALVAQADELDALMLAGQDLDSAAQEMDLTLARFKPVDSFGQGPGARALEGAYGADVDAILDVGFALTPGEPSAMMELAGPRFVAVAVAEVTPRAYQPFEEVRAALEAQWRADTRAAWTRDAAAQALADLEAGSATLDDIAARQGAGGLVPIEDLKRGAAALPVPLIPESLGPIFAAPVGGALALALPTGQAVAVVRERRLPGPDAITPKALEPVRARLTQQVKMETLALYIKAQSARHGVRIYEDRLERIYNRAGIAPKI